MYVDASAIVAIITREPGADALAAALEQARTAITSAMAIYEAALAIRRKRRSWVAEAQDDVADFLDAAGIATVPIGAAEARAALAAFARFGRGEGHPARLNMGDCFAYAVAATHQTTLLFTGGDFRLTDIRAAN